MRLKIKSTMSLQNNKIKACIFDLDGTLTDTLEDIKNAANYAMRSVGLPERTLDEVRRFVGNGTTMLIRRCASPIDDEETIKTALTVYKEYYTQHLCVITAPYDGIIPMLEELKKAGIKAAVLSNKFDSAVKTICDEFFGGLLCVAYGIRSEVPPKPEPQGVYEIMKELECSADETLFVGDSETDIQTAQNAGLKCVGVSWGFRGREFLTQNGADYVIDYPQEMLKIL